MYVTKHVDLVYDASDRPALAIDITEEAIEVGAHALFYCEQHDGEYVRYPLSICHELARVVIKAATLR